MGMSPLTEGRGLKPGAGRSAAQSPAVAPHGGAWIETYITKRKGKKRRVAPHGGAWIET